MEQTVRNMGLKVTESRCHEKYDFSKELHGENKEPRSHSLLNGAVKG